MTRTRVVLTTAGLIAAVLAVQEIVLQLWNLALLGIEFAAGSASGGSLFNIYLFWAEIFMVLHCAAFGLGVYLSLRFFAPIRGDSPWRLTITRGVIAGVSGAIAAFAFSALVSLIAAITIGAYPLGYSLGAGIDANKVQYGISNAIGSALTPLIEWLPLTVLACVFLKIWLAAHPSSVEVTDRVSDSV